MAGRVMSALHAVREASLDAYHNQIVGGREQTQCDLVETEIIRQGLCTRRMIAQALGMETGTVSARVNKLIADGRVVETGMNPCPVTGRSVNWIAAAPAQREMFGRLQ